MTVLVIIALANACSAKKTTTTTTTPKTTVSTTTATTTQKTTAATTTATTTTSVSVNAPALPADHHDGRTACLICHQNGIGGAPKIPTTHATYTDTMCALCHK